MGYSNNLFQIGAVPAFNLNNSVLEKMQENTAKLMQGSVFGKLEDCAVPFVDPAQIDKSLKFTSTAITANSYVMSDSVSLVASLVQEGFESVINHLKVLSTCSDVNQVLDVQQAYANSMHDKLIERTTMNTELLAGVLETNASIAKEALLRK